MVSTFAELAATLRRAAEPQQHPVIRLLAVGRAYLDFAAGRPNHYRVLFQRYRAAAPTLEGHTDVQNMVGADAFGVLLESIRECIATGDSSATSPEATATRVWIGLHGQATLRASLPWFPWPDRDRLLAELIHRLADLDPFATMD